MSNEIVKYENSFNQVILSDLSTIEMNILFAIISRIREKGSRQVRLTDKYLKELTNYHRNNDFSVYVMNTYNKLSQLKGTLVKGSVVARFTLFTGWVYNQDTGDLIVQVNPDYADYFNDLENWTRFALDDFTTLHSTYSKTMFRLLKQYRTIGKRKFTMEEFREQLGIPKSYRPSEINRRVLSYIKEELSLRFQNFKIEKLRKGHRIAGYLFTWTPETRRMPDYTMTKAARQAQALKNIQDNENLTDEERWFAEDRLYGIPLGSTKQAREAQNAREATPIKAEEKTTSHGSSKSTQLDLLAGDKNYYQHSKKSKKKRQGKVKEPVPQWLEKEEEFKRSSPEDIARLRKKLAELRKKKNN